MYSTQKFKKGDGLYAQSLNNMDNQISKNEITLISRTSIENGTAQIINSRNNLFDMRFLLNAGWEKDETDKTNDVYFGQWIDLEKKFYESSYAGIITGSYPILARKSSEYYNFTADFKCENTNSEVIIRLVLGDGTYVQRYIKASTANQYFTITFNVEYAYTNHKGLVGLFFSHSSGNSAVWHIRNARLTETLSTQPYDNNGMNITAWDVIARAEIEELRKEFEQYKANHP